MSRYNLDMQFEWDEIKNKSNREKHGVWFEEAETVFQDNLARVFYDEDHSEDEDRFVIIGQSSSARVLMVVHCYRRDNEVIRLISARKATKNERGFYEEGI